MVMSEWNNVVTMNHKCMIRFFQECKTLMWNLSVTDVRSGW